MPLHPPTANSSNILGVIKKIIHWVQAEIHPEMDTMYIHMHTHSHLKAILKHQSTYLHVFRGGRKPENLKENYTNTRKKPKIRIEPGSKQTFQQTKTFKLFLIFLNCHLDKLPRRNWLYYPHAFIVSKTTLRIYNLAACMRATSSVYKDLLPPVVSKLVICIRDARLKDP